MSTPTTETDALPTSRAMRVVQVGAVMFGAALATVLLTGIAAAHAPAHHPQGTASPHALRTETTDGSTTIVGVVP